MTGDAVRSAVSWSLAVWLVGAAPAWAQQSVEPNTCPEPSDTPVLCQTGADCADQTFATACLRVGTITACRVPCSKHDAAGALTTEKDPTLCANGETCRPAETPAGAARWVCQKSGFRMDLNLVDQCIYHFLNGPAPNLGAQDPCALQSGLTQLLDQNDDKRFDIFDVDLCVLAFLERPACRRDGWTWKCTGQHPTLGFGFEWSPEALGLVPCLSDSDCGAGLHCDMERQVCARECGEITSRDLPGQSLYRKCTGAQKQCRDAMGQCVAVDVTSVRCEVDANCPGGAYCFLGRCAPTCYRTADCPDSEWTCAADGRCRALPHPSASAGFEFVPENYAVRFTRNVLSLDAIQTSDAAQLAIMDLITRRQVLQNPAVSFGYRLELTGWGRVDAVCLVENPPAECLIDPRSQAFVRLAAPFGTVAAVGAPGVTVNLEQAVADGLPPGTYQVTLKAFFDNGGSDSLVVQFKKATPSGRYAGTLRLGLQDAGATLTGNRPLQLELKLHVTEETTPAGGWDALMTAWGLSPSQELQDVTSGRIVHAVLDGNSALAFNHGSAATAAHNRVELVGILADDGTIRLAGAITIPANLCLDEKGKVCDPTIQVLKPDAAASSQDIPLRVTNPFKRDIRRTMLLFGPFDEATGTFSGLYREVLSGLITGGVDVTLSGDFHLVQAVADTTPLGLTAPLNGTKTSFSALDQAAVKQGLEAQKTVLCAGTGDFATARTRFASQSSFGTYLATAVLSGAQLTASEAAKNPLGRTTIFPKLLQFEDAVTQALATLGAAGDTQGVLSVYDYLGQQVLPCGTADADESAICVDEAQARCGLALHQWAILSNWVPSIQGPVAGESDVGDEELFCLDSLPVPGCPNHGKAKPGLFARQQHNRFWAGLAEGLKFDGDRARSDAFLALFRNEVNPFAQGAALSFKAHRLRLAVYRYEQLLDLMVSPWSTAVLWSWPARAFKQAGSEWVATMNTILDDRLSALADLVDLRKRVFMNSGETDFAYAHHLMQQEYLLQVYTMVLQHHWQEELFDYEGQAGIAFERGQAIVNQLDPERNELGWVPGQVYFENTDPTTTNWMHYRGLLAGAGGSDGLLSQARDTVSDGITELKGALSDLDTLEQSLFDSKLALQDELLLICGSTDPASVTAQSQVDACQSILTAAAAAPGDWQTLAACSASTATAAQKTACAEAGFTLACTEPFNGTTDSCAAVAKMFHDGASAAECALPATGGPTIRINGTTAPCLGGDMRAVLQEKKAIDRERERAVGDLGDIMAQLKDYLRSYGVQLGIYDDFLDRMEKKADALSALAALTRATDYIVDATEAIPEGGKCVFIGGLAVGTDCPTKVVGGVVIGIIRIVAAVVSAALEAGKTKLENQIELSVNDKDQDVLAEEAKLALLDIVRSADDVIDEYNTLTQASLNLQLQIDTLQKRAQWAVDRYDKQVGFLADHLVGRESANILVADARVKTAADEFHGAVELAYKMAVAFIHHHNVPPGDATNLRNKILGAVTLDDIEDFVAELDKRAAQYCGLEGIDCDAGNNVEVLRFSVRSLMFPSLRDIVDKDGKVVTAGQQFHNLITAPPFLHRRIRGGLAVDQIELPLQIPVTLVEAGVGGQWLINPLTCNQLLDGRDPSKPAAGGYSSGNVALNVRGSNLGSGEHVLRYEFIRGPTDYVRACHPESIQAEIGAVPTLQYPIRTFTVGYAPHSTEANQSEVPQYSVRSAPFGACIEAPESGGVLAGEGCWRFFARDRTLAALDWKVVVPLTVDGGATENAWIRGDGLKADERPLIEDLVLYFRYRTRPLSEQ